MGIGRAERLVTSRHRLTLQLEVQDASPPMAVVVALRRFCYLSGSSLMRIEPNEQLLSGNSFRWLYNEALREQLEDVSPSEVKATFKSRRD